MKKTPSIITKLLSSCKPDLLGMVIDIYCTEGPDLVAKIADLTNNSMFIDQLNIARRCGDEYLIVVISSDGEILFSYFCSDKQHLIPAFEMADTRVKAYERITMNAWMFLPNKWEFQLLKGDLTQRKEEER